MSLAPGPPTLKRSLNLAMVVLYGLGTTIGAGIYALTGEVAASAGMGAPWAFLLAAAMAAFTALSFAEMCSRFPRSAGEALYVREGLGAPALGTLVGLLVAAAGCVSAATIANAFVGYLGQLLDVAPALAILALVCALGLIAGWGITQSVTLAGLITLIEVGGLLAVIWAARHGLADLPERLPDLLPGSAGIVWPGVLGASLLAFYAFLGFEDMVNIAEEVRDAERTLPRGIVITLVVTALLYVALALAAVLTVPPAELGGHPAPLALIYERATGGAAAPISLIALFAIVNGALIQIIMASRVLYGLACQGSLPAVLGRVHHRTRTPLAATALVTLVVAVLALGLPLGRLAETTSIIALVVFALVNLSLWRLKGLGPAPPDTYATARLVPALGFVISLGFIAYGVAR